MGFGLVVLSCHSVAIQWTDGQTCHFYALDSLFYLLFPSSPALFHYPTTISCTTTIYYPYLPYWSDNKNFVEPLK